jgi:hypothetical protein
MPLKLGTTVPVPRTNVGGGRVTPLVTKVLCLTKLLSPYLQPSLSSSPLTHSIPFSYLPTYHAHIPKPSHPNCHPCSLYSHSLQRV